MRYLIFTGWSDDIVKLVGELAYDEISFSHMALDKKVIIMLLDNQSLDVTEQKIKQYGLLHKYTLERIANIDQFTEYMQKLNEEEKH